MVPVEGLFRSGLGLRAATAQLGTHGVAVAAPTRSPRPTGGADVSGPSRLGQMDETDCRAGSRSGRACCIDRA